MLHGRLAERQEIARMLTAARSGESSALMLVGDTGIGKTALLDWAAEAASDGVVLRMQAVEFEARLPYAALHLLIGPLLNEHLDDIPPMQAEALRAAFTLGSPTVQDRFLVGLAALTVLSELRTEGPALCLIDDAQWLDRASADALLFAARRLGAEGIAMIFASREEFPGTGVRQRRLGPLCEEAAERVLAESASARQLAPQVRRQILADAAGNPLALHELTASLTPEQCSGRLGPLSASLDGRPASSRVLNAFHAQIERLPRRTRSILLLAAADDTGDLGLLLSAARYLEDSLEDLEPAERAGLVYVGPGRLAFRHPLIRTAAYQVASRFQRRAAHRALALALGPAAADLDGPGWAAHADRRVWQLAAATIHPDEWVAAELEEAGDRARGQQSPGDASVAYERAGELSPDDRDRNRRLISAAELAAQSGQLHRARLLTDRLIGTAGLDGTAERDRLDRVLALIEFESGSPQRAGEILIEGARRSEHPSTATGMLIDVARHAVFGSESDLARQAGTALSVVDDSPLGPGLLTAARVLGDEEVDEFEPIRRAVEFLRSGTEEAIDQRLLGVSLSLMAGDETAASELGNRVVEHCRGRGLIGVLPQALALAAQAEMLAGRYDEARVAATEALYIADDIGQAHRVGHLNGILAWLAAITGEDEECLRLAERTDDAVEAGRVMGAWARGLHDLGAGRAEAALEHLAPLWHGGRRHQTVALYAAPDLIEAAVRSDREELAIEPLQRFLHWAEAIGRPWAAAVAARLHGLMAGDEAPKHFEVALELFRSAPGQRFQRARTELALGELRRRMLRRGEARKLLRAALETFDQLGAAPWVHRAQTELRATGESAPSPVGRGPIGCLTPQEFQVVRLAADGRSNRQIGAELFLSPRTVGHHLYKAFPKLGVTSRSELATLDLSV